VLTAQRSNELAHRADLRRVQARARLVEDEQRRVVHQRLRDAHALPKAVRQRAHELAVDVAQGRLLLDVAHAPLGLARRHTTQPRHEGEIAAHGHLVVQRRHVGQKADALAHLVRRRGQIDAQNRLWAAEFFAGQVVMFDPDKQQLKEYPLIEGVKPYTAPYAEPYSASVDDNNHIVWTNDFSSSRIYKIDTITGKSIEYMTPSNYEIRDFKVEVGAAHPTVWIPAYRPPSKLVKVQVR